MNKKEKKAGKGKKVLHIIVDVLVVLVLVISVTVLISVLSSRASGGIPNLFGKAPVGVKTNSMHGDNADSFDEGDLIICDCVENKVGFSYKVGDVVTFMQDLTGDGTESMVTHRIYAVNEDGTYQTKGDNNVTYDQYEGNSIAFPNISNIDILAVYHGTRIPKVGYFVNLIQTPVGFFWIVLVPMIIFFLYEAVRVVMNIMAYSREKSMVAAQEAIQNSELTEEQKAQAIAEYLAAQKQKSEAGGDAPQEEAPKEATPDNSADAAEETSE